MPTPVRDSFRLLLLAIIRQAVWDARRGDADAREWLLSAETRELALALGVPRWPPPGVEGETPGACSPARRRRFSA